MNMNHWKQGEQLIEQTDEHVESNILYVALCYHISDNFCNYLIFAFFAISFKLQIIEYAEIILCIIFYKKLV